MAEQFDVRANQVIVCKARLEGRAGDFFVPAPATGLASPAVDVKSLYAKIGELTPENIFKGALNKAGLLSAMR